MSASRVIFLTSIAMIAFAGNSLLCRAALLNTAIDAASFTTIRLLSGALMLWFIIRLRHKHASGTGNWLSAFALFIYSAGFSYAYINNRGQSKINLISKNCSGVEADPNPIIS